MTVLDNDESHTGRHVLEGLEGLRTVVLRDGVLDAVSGERAALRWSP